MLAWILATSADAHFRDGAKAVEIAKHACEINAWSRFPLLDTLAAAYAETGDFAHAVELQQRAINMAARSQSLADLRARLALYKNGKPFRE